MSVVSYLNKTKLYRFFLQLMCYKLKQILYIVILILASPNK